MLPSSDALSTTRISYDKFRTVSPIDSRHFRRNSFAFRLTMMIDRSIMNSARETMGHFNEADDGLPFPHPHQSD